MLLLGALAAGTVAPPCCTVGTGGHKQARLQLQGSVGSVTWAVGTGAEAAPREVERLVALLGALHAQLA